MEAICPDNHKRTRGKSPQSFPFSTHVRYLKYLHAIGRARNTLRAYAHSLSLYFTYLAQEHLNYACVTLDAMAGFVLWLKNPYRSLKVYPASQALPLIWDQ